jgi:hypothetical protein
MMQNFESIMQQGSHYAIENLLVNKNDLAISKKKNDLAIVKKNKINDLVVSLFV